MFQRNKPDEMEQEIRNKSIIISNILTEVILLIWVVICIFTKHSAIIPLYILLAQLTTKYISRLILKQRVGDDRWKSGLIVFMVVLLGVLFLLITGIGITGGAA